MELILGLIAGAALAVGLFAWLNSRRQAAPAADTPEHLRELARAVGDLRSDVQAVHGRVEGIERQHESLRDNVTRVQLSLESTGSATGGLRQTADAIRSELGKAQQGIARLQEAGQARQQLEASTAESVRRLEAVLAGTQSKGAAGENIVDLVFSRLPAEWQEHDFRVNGKQVEFALRLPNRRVLPIDSKWPATGLIEALAQAESPEEATKARNEVRRAVRDKMAEVQKYLDPELTHAFAIAVVPDAVFEVSGDAQADAFRQKVVLVSYSMFVPYLLVVFQGVLASDHDVDLERLERTLEEADSQLNAMSEEIEGRLSRAMTMLGNSQDALRTQVGRTRSGLGSLHIREGEGANTSPLLDAGDDH